MKSGWHTWIRISSIGRFKGKIILHQLHKFINSFDYFFDYCSENKKNGCVVLLQPWRSPPLSHTSRHQELVKATARRHPEKTWPLCWEVCVTLPNIQYVSSRIVEKDQAWWCGWLSRSRGWTRWTRSTFFVRVIKLRRRVTIVSLQQEQEGRRQKLSFPVVCVSWGTGADVLWSFFTRLHVIWVFPPSFVRVLCMSRVLSRKAAVWGCQVETVAKTQFLHFCVNHWVLLHQIFPLPFPFIVDQILNIGSGTRGVSLSRRLAQLGVAFCYGE